MKQAKKQPLKRWKCPRCNAGVLAPSRPRKLDVRRYCLPCSEATGKLVERTCPALERQRAAKAERRAAQQKGKRKSAAKQRQAAQEAAAARKRPLVMWEAVARHLCHLAAWEGAFWRRHHNGRRRFDPPAFRMSYTRRSWRDPDGHHGTGFGGRWEVALRITAADDGAVENLNLAVHELAHSAHFRANGGKVPKDQIHGPAFHDLYAAAIEEISGARPDMSAGTKWEIYQSGRRILAAWLGSSPTGRLAELIEETRC